ncbi:MAG: SAM-dependent methyltransferase [Betaproteobacteria bacterium]|nr:SAM-dependent methyltransferase [Betaproteobacteria bacterium]
MAESGTLYLIPVPLGDNDPATVLAGAALRVLPALTCFIAENPKSARQFLKRAGYPHPLQALRIETLDEHTADDQLDALLAPLLADCDCGLLSEAGCPAVADPGAGLIRRAHANGVRVVPLVGPSALLLALMGSGMNGQRFAFHGYLPVAREERRRKLVELERRSGEQDATQIFIETPYRNTALLQAVLEACRDDTLLCIAADLTLPDEFLRTWPVGAWRSQSPDLGRRPAVFLLYRLPDR